MSSFLEQIHSPDDLKPLTDAQLKELCGELRSQILTTVSQNGGHLASNLGVVELTVAMHRVFHMPYDSIIWDVGHQCYSHKLLTGRYETFSSLRKTGGISGFPRPSESPYDVFIAGHSSTSVSAAGGFAQAKALKGDDGYTVAVIGDGALTGGLAYEGLSNVGHSKNRLIVVLNDNRMSISSNVGFVAHHLSRLRSRPRYIRFKHGIGAVVSRIPFFGKKIRKAVARAKLHIKGLMYSDSTMFEDMGFYYMGPVSGHNLKDLQKALSAAKALNCPVLVHVETIKGRGYRYAMDNPDIYHGISPFDVDSGKTAACGPNFSSVAGNALTELAKADDRICAITAAMKKGTGLDRFATEIPQRFFDVGIAEEHAVTFSSGMACENMVPVFFVYSTFLQRAYDQILNDTAIIGNHIVLAIDRAGIVPDDGETHQGLFDVPFLTTIPHVLIYSPANFAELRLRMKQAIYDTSEISVVRYPKGNEPENLTDMEPDYKNITHIQTPDAGILLITYGRLTGNVLKAAEELKKQDIPVSVLKLNRIFPIPDECVAVCQKYRRLFFFEESSREGGIAQKLGNLLMENHYNGNYKIYAIRQILLNCSVSDGFRQVGLDAASIVQTVRSAVSNVGKH